jgi:hypothetical protein
MAAGIEIENNQIYLYISFFIPKDVKRANELMTSLIFNVNNPNINKIILLSEDKFPDLSILPKEHKLNKIKEKLSDKLIIEEGEKRRPKYSDFIQLFGKYNPNGINIISNSDIILDYDDTTKIHQIQNNEMWGLTRYEVNQDLENKKYSNIPWKKFPYVHPRLIWTTCTDVWIFRGCFINFNLETFPNIELGIPKCDGFFNRFCLDNGYKIYNFGLDIRSYHYHSDSKRNYPFIYPKGESVLMLPTFLKNKDKIEHFKLWID